jgi:hypothetical protein
MGFSAESLLLTDPFCKWRLSPESRYAKMDEVCPQTGRAGLLRLSETAAHCPAATDDATPKNKRERWSVRALDFGPLGGVNAPA